MLIDERRFNFIPQKKWKNLTEDERKTLGSYKSYYGHYKRTLDEIEELEREIQIRRNKIEKSHTGYLSKLKNLNYKIDHLRSTYNFSWSLSKLTNKNSYNFTISRRGYSPKNGGIGSPSIIHNRLLEFYKRDKVKLEELKKMKPDLKYKLDKRGDRVHTKLYQWIKNEVLFNDKSKVRNFIIDSITKDPTLKTIPMNYKIFFPLPSDKKDNKPKKSSISIHISTKMRMEMTSLGYSKEDMKELTPHEIQQILYKGVSKKPSRGRGRNQ